MTRMMQRMSRVALIALTVSAFGTERPLANDYPNRPVTIIIPAGAGSGPDVITRLVTERLAQRWSQPAIVSNRPGGGGMIATQAMTNVERDGYTLFMPIASTLTVMPELQPKLPIDLDRDLVPIALVGTQPMMIAVHSSLGINSLPELVVRAKSRPADLLLGTARGTIPHMTWELLRDKAQFQSTIVPYSTSARAIQDALSGTVNVLIESPAALAPVLKSGSVRPLAVAAAARLANYPDVPTVAESMPSLGSFEAGGWLALMAPSGTPEVIVNKLSEDVRTVLSQGDLKLRFEALGTYVRVLSPQETKVFIRTERDLWRPIVRHVGTTQ